MIDGKIEIGFPYGLHLDRYRGRW